MKNNETLNDTLDNIINEIVPETIKSDVRQLSTIRNLAYFNFINKPYFRDFYEKSFLLKDVNGFFLNKVKHLQGRSNEIINVNEKYIPYDFNNLTGSTLLNFESTSSIILNDENHKLLHDFIENVKKSKSLKDIRVESNDIPKLLKNCFNNELNKFITLISATEQLQFRNMSSSILPRALNNTLYPINEGNNDETNRVLLIRQYLLEHKNELNVILDLDNLTHLSENKSNSDLINIFDEFSNNPVYKKSYLGIILNKDNIVDKYIAVFDKYYFKRVKSLFLNLVENNIDTNPISHYKKPYHDILTIINKELESAFPILCKSNYERKTFSKIDKNNGDFDESQLENTVKKEASSNMILPNDFSLNSRNTGIDVDNISLYYPPRQDNIHINLYKNELECLGVIKLLENNKDKNLIPVVITDNVTFSDDYLKEGELNKIVNELVTLHDKKIILLNTDLFKPELIDKIINDNPDIIILRYRKDNPNKNYLNTEGNIVMDRLIYDNIKESKNDYASALSFVKKVRTSVKENTVSPQFFENDPKIQLSNFNIQAVEDFKELVEKTINNNKNNSVTIKKPSMLKPK